MIVLRKGRWYRARNFEGCVTTRNNDRRIVDIDGDKLRYIIYGSCEPSDWIKAATFIAWGLRPLYTSASPKCRHRDCCNRPKSRGVCHNHYMQISNQISAGKLTLEEAVARKLWNDARPKLVMPTHDPEYLAWLNSSRRLVVGNQLCWCGETAKVRGLCLGHYMRVTNLIRNGIMTRVQLIDKGKLLESKRTDGLKGITKGYGYRNAGKIIREYCPELFWEV